MKVDQSLTQNSDTSPSTVPALRRSVQTLDLISNSKGALSAADIGRLLGLPKSTVDGHLKSMIELELLRMRRGRFLVGAHPARRTRGSATDFDIVAGSMNFFPQAPTLRVYDHANCS